MSAITSLTTEDQTVALIIAAHNAALMELVGQRTQAAEGAYEAHFERIYQAIKAAVADSPQRTTKA